MSQQVRRRKHTKKRTLGEKRIGITAAESRKFDADFTHGQTRIAECLGVDRSTVARWCREGLPYERGEVGEEYRIKLRTAIPWTLGHRWATANNIEASSLEKILWALAYGFIDGTENPSFGKWRLEMLDETEWFNASRERIAFGIGRLTTMPGFPFKQIRW